MGSSSKMCQRNFVLTPHPATLEIGSGMKAPAAPELPSHNFSVCLFVLEFYGPVNNEVMSSRSVSSSTVPGQA